MIFLNRDSKNLNQIFYHIKKYFIIETYQGFREELNYNFSELIVDKLNSDKNICYSLKYFIFTSELCIPIGEKNISSRALSILKELRFKEKISLFEWKMFGRYLSQQASNFSLDKIKINFIDINLYSNYALKLGFSKTVDWLMGNNFAALFVDFNVSSLLLSTRVLIIRKF